MVNECLRESGLQPQHLKLEITESAIVPNPQSASKVLERLRGHGIQISLDDFGTGYSSLSYLQNFKIDTLKIDRSFISRLNSSDESDEIVRTIVHLAHSLGMEVVAEGIEDSSMHSHLQSLGCESGQGYLYSRPLCVAGIEDLLQEETVKQLLQLDLSSALASGTSPLPEIVVHSD
jgi:EAL domain-containing protein (putative c-di-GMP-specific phosphodiesterase class I)